MSFNVHLYDKLCEERRQSLQQEAARRRVLACLPVRPGVSRQAIGKLGRVMVAIGSRLEGVDQAYQHGKPVRGALSYESHKF